MGRVVREYMDAVRTSRIALCRHQAPSSDISITIFYLFCLHLPSYRAGVDVWLTFWSARHTIQHILNKSSK
jgi:hypothetical protein